MPTTPTTLYLYLRDLYEGPPPNPVHAPPPVNPISLDDYNSKDCYQGFCHINAWRHAQPDTIKLVMHNAPYDPTVLELVEQHHGTIQAGPEGKIITLPLTAKDAPLVRKLAKVIRKITGRGRSYSDRNLKWICPRTAASLERLAKHLLAFSRSAVCRALT